MGGITPFERGEAFGRCNEFVAGGFDIRRTGDFCARPSRAASDRRNGGVRVVLDQQKRCLPRNAGGAGGFARSAGSRSSSASNLSSGRLRSELPASPRSVRTRAASSMVQLMRSRLVIRRCSRQLGGTRPHPNRGEPRPAAGQLLSYQSPTQQRTYNPGRQSFLEIARSRHARGPLVNILPRRPPLSIARARCLRPLVFAIRMSCRFRRGQRVSRPSVDIRGCQ